MDRFSTLDGLAKGIRAYIILFSLTLIAAAPGVFTMPALDRDESRFAQASKQMLETGDYIVIRYQDEQRNKKPAGIHWLQAGTTAVFSSAEARQIWSYRLPSFIGGALATCALFWAGIPLIGRRAAFLGSALFATGVLLTSEAHISKTDGVLVAITTLGVGALVHLRARSDLPDVQLISGWLWSKFNVVGVAVPAVIIFAGTWMLCHAINLTNPIQDTLIGLAAVAGFALFATMKGAEAQTRRMAILFWFAMGFGFLIKGPVTLMVAGLAGLAIALWERKANWLKPVLWWPGPVLFILMVLPWFISIQLATEGNFVEGAVGKDLRDKLVSASEGHGGPPGYHLLHLITHFFPATLFLIPAIVLTVKDIRAKVENASGLMFIAAWAIPTWLVFEFLPTKLSHYVLPAYPALALLCGYTALRLIEGVKLPVSRWFGFAMFIIGGVAFTVIASTLGMELLRAEPVGDFKTADPETVLAIWSQQTVPLWPVIILGVFLTAVTAASVLRRYQMAIVFAILSSVAIGWHIRITTLPGQTWIQPTVIARAALADVCGLPDQEGCEVTPDLVQSIGYAEPSLILTTGTDVLHSPEASTDLPTANEVPVASYVINLENKLGDGAIETIEANAADQGRCVLKSPSHYGLNYSNGDPVHFIALKVLPGACPETT